MKPVCLSSKLMFSPLFHSYCPCRSLATSLKYLHMLSLLLILLIYCTSVVHCFSLLCKYFVLLKFNFHDTENINWIHIYYTSLALRTLIHRLSLTLFLSSKNGNRINNSPLAYTRPKIFISSVHWYILST